VPAGDEEETQGMKCVFGEMRRSSTGTATRARYHELRGIRRSEISRQVLKSTGPDSKAIVKRSLDTQRRVRERSEEIDDEERDAVIRMH